MAETDFSLWWHASLVAYATEAKERVEALEAALRDAAKDRHDLLVEIRKLLGEKET